MEKKYWKSQGILSAQKSGNPDREFDEIFNFSWEKSVVKHFSLFLFLSQSREK